MSGIVAVFSKNTNKYLKSTKRMLNKIQHRGPGKQKIYRFKKAILGKNQKKQENLPNFKAESPVVIADELIMDDNFSSEKDILKSYVEKGDEFVKDLSGPFAFVIYDGKKLFAARDPLGLKPLYYIKKNETIILASEIKALIEYGEKIHVFPPGHYYSSEKGFVKYFHYSVNEFDEITTNQAAEELRERIIDTVDKSCEKDSCPGVFLSGGLDSSVIAAACREVCEAFDTFAVGVEGSSDLENARKVADYLGTRHNEYVYSLDDMLEVLPEVIYHLESFDMYLVRSAVINYLLTRNAKSCGKNMILCGEGADELFAGYQYLKKMDLQEAAQEIKKLIFLSHANGFQRVDRVTSAFSIEPCLPFVDQSVAEFAFKLPIEMKLYDDEGRKIEKWILRKAFEKYLPEDIVWRKKQKFFEGAGSGNLLEKYAEEKISDEEYCNERQIHPDITLRSKEELLYYKIFVDFFPNSCVLDTVGFTRTV